MWVLVRSIFQNLIKAIIHNINKSFPIKLVKFVIHLHENPKSYYVKPLKNKKERFAEDPLLWADKRRNGGGGRKNSKKEIKNLEKD